MKDYFIESVLERANTKPLFFYHMVPKKANISKGLLAPYAMNKFGMEKELSFSLDKYRNRLVDTDAWNIYPNRDPKSLSNEEILNGINQFRKSEDGSKYIYFFRYPPYKELGKNMETILKSKDIYRINLNDKELQKQILDISWGWIGSNTDNQAVNKKWYETIKPEKYFSVYNDNPKNGTPLFAPLVHIGIAFKNGICQRKFLTKINQNEISKITMEASHKYAFMPDAEYKTINGKNYPIVTIGNKMYKPRAELLILRENKVFLYMDNGTSLFDQKYRVPGGGIDKKDKDITDTAIREAQEEARITAKNVVYSGHSVVMPYIRESTWQKEHLWPYGVKYAGGVSYICVAEYSSEYRKRVDKSDQDVIENGKWYKLEDVKDLLIAEHKSAILEYLSFSGIKS